MPDTARRPTKRDTTLSKGLTILEALSESPHPIGVTEVAAKLKLTKSNAFRLLQTLSDMGYVTQPDGRNYAATSKIWRAASRWTENLHVRNCALTDMLILAQDTGETAYLGVLDQAHVLCIERVDGGAAPAEWSMIGGRVPVHCSAMGKALLAESTDPPWETLAEPFPRFTNLTLTTAQELQDGLTRTRLQGYGHDQGEFRHGIQSFAIAIRNTNGPCAALAVSVPDARLGSGRDAEIIALLKSAAGSIRQKLQMPHQA